MEKKEMDKEGQNKWWKRRRTVIRCKEKRTRKRWRRGRRK
jgi:hypothetical protein